MEISSQGLGLIRQYESLSLVPYQDAASLWTVGWGHKLTELEPIRGITSEEAERLLADDVATAERGVERLCFGVKLSQGQFDALVSFAFNVGLEALRESTLLRLLKAGDVAGAADEFPKWDHVHHGAKVVELTGLLRRRQAERAMFLAGTLERSA